MKATQNFLNRIPFTLALLAGLVIGALITNTYFEQITHQSGFYRF